MKLIVSLILFLFSSVFADQCYSNRYDIRQQIHNDNSIGLNIARGNVDNIAVYWHDDLGDKTNARGRVYLDNSYLGEDDIKKEGNISHFYANFYSNGNLRISILEDDAYIYWVQVTYCGNNPPPNPNPYPNDWYTVQNISNDLNRSSYQLFVDGDYEAKNYGGPNEQRAANDMNYFYRDANNFYNQVRNSSSDNTYVRQAYNNLVNSYRYLVQDMRYARFSNRVMNDYSDCNYLMDQLNRYYRR